MRALCAAGVVLALLASQVGPLAAQSHVRKSAVESRTEALSVVVQKLGSFDAADRYQAAPATIPSYDPWEPSSIRAARALELRKWWKARGRSPSGVL
jgi:hypothetical protein